MSERRGAKVALDIPARDRSLFRSQTVHDVLSFLCRYHTDEFSISELTEAVEYTQPSVSKAIDILAANDLVVERRAGNARQVNINTDRLFRPDDPNLRIPQAEFHEPVRATVDELEARLENVVGIVVYGSVANGVADRRSDIDLWVLVEEDRMENQRTGNQVRQDLEDSTFDSSRYAYEIDMEALPAVPSYADDLREVLSGGIVLHSTEKFEAVRNMIFHGELDG